MAYHAFLEDANLHRPAGFRFHKALMAIVAGGWDGDEPGVSVVLRHESNPGIQIVDPWRPAEETYPDCLRS